MSDIHTEIRWSADAYDRWKELRSKAYSIGAAWGPNEGDRAMLSLLSALASLVASGPVTAHRDSDGLLFVTEHIMMGLVFHQDSDERIADRTGYGVDEVRTVPATFPRPGTWSLHS